MTSESQKPAAEAKSVEGMMMTLRKEGVTPQSSFSDKADPVGGEALVLDALATVEMPEQDSLPRVSSEELRVTDVSIVNEEECECDESESDSERSVTRLESAGQEIPCQFRSQRTWRNHVSLKSAGFAASEAALSEAMVTATHVDSYRAHRTAS